MQRVVVHMQNYVFSEAIERALRSDGDFIVAVVEKSGDVVSQSRMLAANALLMEVTGLPPFTIEDRLRIRDDIKAVIPNCKTVLLVDENSDNRLAEQVKQAKRDGIIDQFIYGSTSANFLVALMDTL